MELQTVTYSLGIVTGVITGAFSSSARRRVTLLELFGVNNAALCTVAVTDIITVQLSSADWQTRRGSLKN